MSQTIVQSKFESFKLILLSFVLPYIIFIIWCKCQKYQLRLCSHK